MKMILKETEEKSSGKLKKLAKSLSEHVVSEPALKDKVVKAYKGFDTWKALKPCISEDWFKEDEIENLGNEANLWRNELAHSKRSYEPKLETIRSVRLLEHLNYAIVLRQLGYEDDEIKYILQFALKR